MITNGYKHIHCVECNKGEQSYSLPSCGVCTSCCKAKEHSCIGCNDHKVRLCTRCGYGRSCGCCYCADDFKYTKSWTVDYNKDMKYFKNKRLVGVEWEFNEAKNGEFKIEDWADKWHSNITEDGSCGREAITAPLAGDYISKCLIELGEAFQLSKVKVDKSCSVHVHVDARDFDWNKITNLTKLYSRFEPLLYLLGGQSRSHNEYCIPNGVDYKKVLDKNLKPMKEREELLSIIYNFNDTKQAVKHHKSKYKDKKGEGRYRGMNLVPWAVGKSKGSKDTTVEFRIHKDTLNTNRVINWAQLLADFVEYSSKTSKEKIDKLPSSDLRAMIKIIPKSKSFILQRIKDWRLATSLDPKNKKRRIKRKISILPGGKFKIKP